jgi:hypothetical protein
MKFMCAFCSLILILFFAAFCFPADQTVSLQPGQASGTLSAEGKVVNLSHAAVFVDQDEKPNATVLILSDEALPISTWKNSSDMMMYRREHKFGGVAFWLNDKREVVRTEYYAGTFPTSASGIFELKLESPTEKNLKGSANSTATAAKLTDPVKLEARFNAELK